MGSISGHGSKNRLASLLTRQVALSISFDKVLHLSGCYVRLLIKSVGFLDIRVCSQLSHVMLTALDDSFVHLNLTARMTFAPAVAKT